MALDSEPSFISHPAPEQPLADKLPLLSIMSDEHTPLLNPAKITMGNGTPAGIPVPHSRGDDDAVSGPRRLPQAIAHRGYKVVAPENTMLAFRAAVEVGAHAIETDLHLSKDGVVVLSHDDTLKRCFGEDAKVRDHDWSYLSTLRTVRKPAQPMPRLLDLLEFLNQPGLEHVWVMLDIKVVQRDDDATELMQRTAETIASVPGIRPWGERILPCCWTSQYVKLSMEYLPEFRIANVGFSSIYARAMAANVPNLSISMVRFTLALPVIGQRFIRDMKRSGHPIHVWTVDDEDWMEWCIRKELDGVITDDPKLFLEVCGRASKEAKSESTQQPGRKRSIAQSLAKGARECREWARYFLFMGIAMTIYFFTAGLPSRQVRKTLGT
ncbi:PLC-like phosphodiesterase [Hypoxylon crocopeplum]|nr:PLC-like phosphodiesterase [Hypoxylon crocopeplum]